MPSRKIMFFLRFSFAAALLYGSLGFSADLQRDMDPIVGFGKDMPGFVGKPISSLRAYRYNAASNSWSAIPIQVDETDGDGSFFGRNNGLLDDLDEVLIMAKDLGDQAASDQIWPDADQDSKQNPRYEIRAADESTLKVAHAYLFSSATLTASNVSYVNYKDERVYGETYGVAHHPQVASGLPDSLAIPTAVGGDGINFLNRHRVRIDATMQYGSISFTPPTIKEKMDENISLSLFGSINLKVYQKRLPDVVVGPVRVKRRNVMSIWVKGSAAGQDIDKMDSLRVTYTYYPRYLELWSEARLVPDIKPSNDLTARITRMSLTQNLNGNGFGMIYYNQNLPGGVRMNDVYHSSVDRSLTGWPGKSWFGMVSDPGYANSGKSAVLTKGTLFTILDLRGDPLGTSQAFNFNEFDDNDGSRSYGDGGLRMVASSGTIAGVLDVLMKSYVIPENMSFQDLSQLYARYSVPLQVTAIKQYNDHVAPAAIADFEVKSIGNGRLTFGWIATADDGNTGLAARQYIIKYSVQPVGDDLDAWWTAATTVANPPLPKQPGQAETYTLTGLEANTPYYSAIRVLDEAENFSAITLAAPGIPTPVELASFSAWVVQDRIMLAWQTRSESNNFGFSLERKSDQENIWQQISFVAGSGTTADLRSYAYEDHSALPGTFYYRLKQLDANGQFTYSTVIEAVVQAPLVFSLEQNYPNPFNPNTVIGFQIPAKAGGRALLKIYDLLGRDVRTLFDQPAQSGYYRLEWDGKDDFDRTVGSGVYLYVLSTGSGAHDPQDDQSALTIG